MYVYVTYAYFPLTFLVARCCQASLSSFNISVSCLSLCLRNLNYSCGKVVFRINVTDLNINCNAYSGSTGQNDKTYMAIQQK